MEDFYEEVKEYVYKDKLFNTENNIVKEHENVENYNDLYLDSQYRNMYSEALNQEGRENGFNVNSYIKYVINS